MPNGQTHALCDSIADTIKDYRRGQIPQPDRAHVAKWVGQFDPSQQLGILTEMDRLLKTTYITRANMETFLGNLVTNQSLTGNKPYAFWPTVNFLDIQQRSESQRDMLAMFAPILQTTLGVEIAKCGVPRGPYVYLDDVSCSGQRVRLDLSDWIKSVAPQKATLHVIVGAIHSGGWWYAQKEVANAASAANKTIDVTWWKAIELDERRNNPDTSDVFKPSSLPNTPAMNAYLSRLQSPPPLRNAGQMGQCQVFDTEAGRDLLEQQFLEVGLHIRAAASNLPPTERPLGHASANSYRTLGFGSTIVTFRNCPNNCPLAFWAGDPWYPLFPRRTNTPRIDLIDWGD
jgi:hypothetical protein